MLGQRRRAGCRPRRGVEEPSRTKYGPAVSEAAHYVLIGPCRIGKDIARPVYDPNRSLMRKLSNSLFDYLRKRCLSQPLALRSRRAAARKLRVALLAQEAA